jgi:putative hydrolase of the HAD superfamily
MTAASEVRAVTFDYWNTIVRADADQASYRVRAWQEEYSSVGHEVDEETIRIAFRAVWDEHHASWLRNEQYQAQRAGDLAVDLVARPVDPATRTRLVERFLTAGEEAGFTLCDGIDGALEDLRRRGIRLGIICDVGFTPSAGLRRMLEGFGLLDHFDGWSFSDDVGWYKPAPEIFRHALDYLGSTPDTTVHIGDLRRTDVAGARGMGMTSVRYRGANDDDSPGPEGDHVLDDHAALMDALAL